MTQNRSSSLGSSAQNEVASPHPSDESQMPLWLALRRWGKSNEISLEAQVFGIFWDISGRFFSK